MADALPQDDPGQDIEIVIVTLTTSGADFTWNPALYAYVEPEEIPALARRVGEHLIRLGQGFQRSASDVEEAMRP